MKNYYVLVPDADEFEIVRSVLVSRFLEKGDILIVSDFHQISEGNIRKELSVQLTKDGRKYRVHFIQSGVGKVATCRTMKKLFKAFAMYGAPAHIIMAGSACGKIPGIYNVTYTYQEIDLRPAGRGIGESPDLPRFYRCSDTDLFGNLTPCDTLTVERFCSEFPDTTEYGMSLDSSVVDMEDYAFAAMISDEEIPYSIVRGVTDEGNFVSWKESLNDCISKIVEIIFNRLDP